jgi:hypothetical protein
MSCEAAQRLGFNKVIVTSTDRVEQLWHEGNEPQSDNEFLQDNAIISQDNQWLIHRYDYKRGRDYFHDGLSAQEVCVNILEEFVRLKQQSMPIMSHGFLPSKDGGQIYSIRPYLKNIYNCSRLEFGRFVAPALKRHLIYLQKDSMKQSNQGQNLYLQNIYSHDEYSKTAPIGSPFLRSIHPMIKPANKQLWPQLSAISSLALEYGS